MANPRRNTLATNFQIPISVSINPDNTNPFQSQTLTAISSLKHFFKKPHSIPFLLSIFLFLTWVSLRLQHHPSAHLPSSYTSEQHRKKWGNGAADDDRSANLVRFAGSGFPSPIAKDKRGWMVDPISLALKAGLSGGALTCSSLHIGEIRPAGLRGNHRHHTCNETFLIWGAKTVFRMENNARDKGYAEVIIAADEVAVSTSPSGTAHALVNIDPTRTTFFLGCQDVAINYNSSTSDFNVWKDL